jgi:hypothetical protein
MSLIWHDFPERAKKVTPRHIEDFKAGVVFWALMISLFVVFGLWSR